MEFKTAELLDKILIYLDLKNVRKKWLDILTELNIDTENEKYLLIELKKRDYILEIFTTIKLEQMICISEKGRNFINTSSFVQLTEKEKEEDEFKKLQTENLTLQNTLLDLQTKQQKRYILYSSISFILGVIVTNGKEILKFLQSAFQE